MARPPKPFTVLKSEGKSHRTKSEMKMREEGEKKLLTGQKLREHQDVKENEVAHKEFLRIKKLLEKIDPGQDLHLLLLASTRDSKCSNSMTTTGTYHSLIQMISAFNPSLIVGSKEFLFCLESTENFLYSCKSLGGIYGY